MNVHQGTSPRFDWYSASFQPSGSLCGDFLPLTDESPRAARPRMGFDTAFELRREGSTIARVMAGRRHDWAYVEASGQDAEPVAALLRLGDIPHAVARVDACTDVISHTAYQQFERTLMTVLPPRVTRTRFEQTKHGRTASTLYLGSRKSESFARLYEKGKESPETYHADTVRIEVQSRPKGPGRKAWAATATPHEIMSLPRWSDALLDLVSMGRLPTIAPQKRQSDLDRALAVMGAQYRKRVHELLARNGGDLDETWQQLQKVFDLTA